MSGQAKMQKQSEYVLSANLPIGTVEKKRCSMCGETKPLEDFSPNTKCSSGRRSECKVCLTKSRGLDRAANVKRYREKEAGWRAANPEMLARKRARQRALYAANREKAIEKTRKWQDANKGKNIETRRLWRKNNPEKVHAQLKRSNKKLRGTVRGNLEHRMSNYIRQSLQGKKERKSWKTLVDFSFDQLKKHLEKKFLPGMSWENRNLWHVDHIIPVTAFNYSRPEHIDFKRCWSLENLQPLWKIDNIKKGNKLLRPFQPTLMIGGLI